MLDQEEAFLGDALGQLYVREYFSADTKPRYDQLTDEIFAAFSRADPEPRLDERSHQGARAPEARRRESRRSATPSAGGTTRRYAVDRGSFLGNAVRGNIWQSDYDIAKLHKPVDRTEWDMTPQTYNAYYNPSNNEIVLPAAVFILPGIADSLVDDAHRLRLRRRHHHRPRDHARLRRPGPPVRRARQPRELVDAGGRA